MGEGFCGSGVFPLCHLDPFLAIVLFESDAPSSLVDGDECLVDVCCC